MEARLIARRLLMVALVAAGILTTGCTYMEKRGRDAMDMFDVGVTASAKPQFSLYFDFFSLFNLGYSNQDSVVLGMVNRRAGLLDYESHAWGALVYGSMKDGAKPFDPKDPHQARPDQREATERPRFDTGLARVPGTDNPPPWPQYIMCRRAIHLGWIGVVFNLRPVDMVDFLLGWGNVDIVGDDTLVDDENAKPTTEEKTGKESKG